MAYNFTVSPDFGPDHLAGWFIFNTWLQRTLGVPVHLEIYPDFETQRAAIRADQVDLIFANPYDAAMLVREKGFVSLARPAGKSDEALIAVKADCAISSVEELTPGMRIAITSDPDVHMMGMIMLEPADLDAENVDLIPCDNYVMVAKKLIRGDCDAGIFLDEAFHDLSAFVRNELRILVSSQIQLVHHALMLGPGMKAFREPLLDALLAMPSEDKGRGVLQGLGYPSWEEVDQEAMEFMIDLVDTLMV